MAISGALELAHVQSKTILLANGLFLPLPIAWICLLPVCGAMGAIISRRSGGSRLDRMMAGAFPAAIMLAVQLLMLVAGWVISQFVADHAWNWVVAVPGLGLWMTGYVILTATALLLGVAAADRIEKTQSRAL
jgi:protein-S-isoprenylcysteine O-methyltransferase Ste14